MKKILFIAIILIATAHTANAQESKQDTIIFTRTCSFAESVDILGFEKRLKDKNELYIIRNNTTQTITLIKLRVYYKTPEGDMLDYRDVELNGELLPKTTKQFEIASFDKGKRYYYYQSAEQNPKMEGYPFKITYELLRYDVSITK